MKAKTTLLHSASGVGKTNQLFRLMRYWLEKERKVNPNAKMRLIHADGGGWAPFEDSGYIDKGLCEAFDITKRDEAFADIKRLGDGYWPINPNTPQEVFNKTPACEASYEDYPILGIEGITSIANAWLAHISDQEAGMGFKFSYKVTESEYSWGGLQEGHYGIVQKEMRKLIHAFGSLPYKRIIWTALTTKAEDKISRMMILGPEVVGQAVTHHVPQWLGETFYLEPAIAVVKDKDGVESNLHYVRAWFEKGIDTETGVPFSAKGRCGEDVYPILKEKFKNGYVPCVAGRQGLEKYYDELERINKQVYDQT